MKIMKLGEYITPYTGFQKPYTPIERKIHLHRSVSAEAINIVSWGDVPYNVDTGAQRAAGVQPGILLL